MAALTTLRPWIFGGSTYSFSAKPFTEPTLTQLRVWAFAGQRYGSFGGRTPQADTAQNLKPLVVHPAYLTNR